MEILLKNVLLMMAAQFNFSIYIIQFKIRIKLIEQQQITTTNEFQSKKIIFIKYEKYFQ